MIRPKTETREKRRKNTEKNSNIPFPGTRKKQKKHNNKKKTYGETLKNHVSPKETRENHVSPRRLQQKHDLGRAVPNETQKACRPQGLQQCRSCGKLQEVAHRNTNVKRTGHGKNNNLY